MPSVLYELKDVLAIITLNRPEKFNSFNREMAFLLQEYLDKCATDPQVRCVMITGAGKAFSAGQDLGELTGDNPVGIDQILSEHYNPIISRIRNLAKPVVAAVNGVAAGAGANIALCCDIVMAAKSASFIQAFSKIGLVPDSGGTYFLPRLIGWQKAGALMMLGEKLSATEAERIGMIYSVTDDVQFEEACMHTAQTLSRMPTKGLAYTKQALNQSLHSTLEEQLNNEDVLQRKAADTYDYKEGVAAFIEKRIPVFKGE